MGENTDKLKGHAKEAAGDITDDKSLEREGKVDKTSGKVKGKVDDITDKLKD
ncbi:MAG: CsbD family protein [Actinomycetota bacterium]|nr:CsbD family protein [Actinomycetota bacterium]